MFWEPLRWRFYGDVLCEMARKLRCSSKWYLEPDDEIFRHSGIVETTGVRVLFLITLSLTFTRDSFRI